MKKHKKEAGTMAENIKISVNILPFGQMKLMFGLSGKETENKEHPTYVEPQTTNVERIEIFYEGKEREYKIPETTDGR